MSDDSKPRNTPACVFWRLVFSVLLGYALLVIVWILESHWETKEPPGPGSFFFLLFLYLLLLIPVLIAVWSGEPQEQHPTWYKRPIHALGGAVRSLANVGARDATGCLGMTVLVFVSVCFLFFTCCQFDSLRIK